MGLIALSALQPVMAQTASSLNASKGTYTNRVSISVYLDASCGGGWGGTSLWRDGTNIWTGGNYSGWLNFDDTGVTPGVNYTYAAKASCDVIFGDGPVVYDTGYAQAMSGYAAPPTISASDGSYGDRIHLTMNYPDQTANCSTITYNLFRDGAHIGGAIFPLTAGTYDMDDMNPTPGSHSYQVRADCAPGGTQTWSGSDSGYASYTPYAATLSASDGSFADRVRVTVNGPDQSARCTSTSYRIYRGGSVIGNLNTVPNTGGAGVFDDTTANLGQTYTYTANTVCSPGGLEASSSGDTGYRAYGTPLAASVSATDGTYSDRVRVTVTAPNQSSTCTSTNYDILRNGSQVGSISSIANTGGSGYYDDISVVPGTVYAYTARSVCTPGGQTALSTADNGNAAYGTPLASTVSATDSTYFDKVRVTVTAPNQSAYCTSTSYQVKRGATVVGTITTISNTGGSDYFDDTGVTPGTIYSYTAVSVCSPGGNTAVSGADNGNAAYASPLPANSISATDGLYTDKVVLTFTGPNQSAYCSSTNYVVVRNGSDQATITTIPNTGGPGSYNDTTAVPGTTYTYSVRSVCTPGGLTANSGSDTGYRLGTPLAPTGVSASDGAFSTKTVVSFTGADQSGQCSSVSYAITRDGSDIGTVTTVPVTGGAGSYDDGSGVAGQTYTYAVRAICTPGSQSATSTSDTGWRLGVPLPATSVSATDGSSTANVTVNFFAPNQATQCSSTNYVVVRNGSDLATITTIPNSGGANNYVDTTAVPGTIYTYAVRSVCTPGGQTSLSGSDTGYRLGVPLAPSAVSATDGAFAAKTVVTWTGADQSGQCSSVSYTVTRNGTDLSTITTIPVTGGAGTYDDTTGAVAVTYTYGVRANCTPGAQSTNGPTDTGFRMGSPLAATSVVASDGAFSTKVAITWAAPDQSAQCTSTNYVVVRNGTDLGTVTTVPNTGGAGNFDDSTAVPGTTYTYSIRSVCTPGGQTIASASDTGYRLGTPSAPTAVAATDGAFTTKTSVTWTSPDQSGQCASVTYTITRNGTDLSTVSSVPLTGGAGSFDDLTGVAGVSYNYAVRANCSPGSQTAVSAADSGWRLGSPLVVTGLAASDGASPLNVAVTFTSPDQSAQCSSTNYVVVRDGADIATITTIPNSGGAGNYLDTTAVPGTVYAYGIRSVCTPGGQSATSPTDSGYRLGSPAAPTGVAATDGAFSTKTVVTFTALNQVGQCSSTSYNVLRNGVDIGVVGGVPNSGGAGSFDDATGAVGVTYNYTVRATCTPGGQTADSTADTGYRIGTPLAATSVQASDGSDASKVVITWTAPNQGSMCTSTDYVVVRDGVDIGTVTTIPNGGGAGSFDDTTATPGTVYAYGIRAVCSPGGSTTNSSTDTGFRLGTPLAPTLVQATDGTSAAKTTVTWTSPDQSGQCSTVTYTVTRNGTDIGTVTTIPTTGGAGTYDDSTGTAGTTYTYAVRANCTPGGQTATSATDTGWRIGTPLAVTALTATDGTSATMVSVSFTAPDQSSKCSAIQYVVTRDGADIGAAAGVALTGGAGTFDDTTVGNGVHTYGVRSVCTPGLATANSATDTGYKLANPQPVMTVMASDGTSSTKVLVAFTAPDQSAYCASASYVVARDGVDLGSVTTVPLTGGASSFDDTSGAGGVVYTYSVRPVCLPGSTTAIGATDTGFRKGSPAKATAVAASDGLYPDKVTIAYTAPDQTNQCSSVEYVIVRDGIDIFTESALPVTGGAGSYEDFTATPGSHSYTVRAVCTPGGNTAVSTADTGFKIAVPLAATSVSATDGTSSTKTVVSFVAPDQTAQCTASNYVIVRDGTDLTTLSTIPLAGGPVSYDDTTGVGGQTYTYAVRTTCAPGTQTALSSTDTGFRLGQPLAATAVAASDGTSASSVEVTFISPNQSTQCAAVNYVIVRDGVDIGSVATVPLTGGPGAYSDTTAVVGTTYTYAVRSDCSPGTASALSTANTGFVDTPPSNLSAVGSANFNAFGDLVITVTDPDAGEVLTYAVETPPSKGNAVVIGSKIRYTPSDSEIGVDTFQISATDRAGAKVTGLATVTIVCAPHTMGTLTVTPSRSFGGGGFTANGSYSANGCPVTFSATYELLSGTNSLETASLSDLPSGQNQPAVFNRTSPSSTGNYTVKVTVKNDITGVEVFRTATLPVEAFKMPTFTWASNTVVAGVESAKLTMGNVLQCTVTGDDAAARANPSLCLVTLEGAPAEVGVNLGTGYPTWSGTPSVPGSYAAVARISQYDAQMALHSLGTVNVPITVEDPSSIVFTSPATMTAQQYIGAYAITPTQQAGSACTVYADVASAAAKAAVGQRACLFTWTSTSTDFVSDGKTLTGAIFDTNPVTNSWTLNIVRGDSSLMPLGTGSTVVNPEAVTLAINLTPSPASPTANVTPVTITASSVGSAKCSGLTTNATLASTSGLRPCLVEFGTLDGLVTDTFNSGAAMKGKLPTAPVTTIPYTVSIFFKGTKHQILTGSQDIASTPPNAPLINFEYVRQLGEDMYAVSTVGGSIGVLATDTSQGDLNGSMQLDTASSPTLFYLAGAKRRQVMQADAAPLYSSRQMNISLTYAALPTVSSNRTITVVSVPRDGLKLNLVGVPSTAPDTTPMQVTAMIGESTKTGFKYIRENAGSWNVTFGEVALNGTFLPLTDAVVTDDNGMATASINVAGKALVRLAARATPINEVNFLTSITSRTQVVSVVKGTPIVGYITSMGPATGPAPYLSVLRINFETRADQLANSSVTWLQSTDGGESWSTPPGASGIQYGARFDVGTYLLKVKFVNTNTKEESCTPVFTVQAYPVPKIAINGSSYFLPGAVLTNTAVATDEANNPIPNAVWSWEFQRNVLGSTPIVLASGDSPDISFTTTETGVFRLVVKARDPSAQGGDLRAYATMTKQIIVGAPAKPSLRLNGPMRLETSKSGSYLASATTSFDIATSDLKLGGEWKLPDGTKVSGTTLTWTPTNADYDVSRNAALTYSAWIIGYEEATTVTATIPVALWKYQWPNWRMAKSVTGTVAPVSSQFMALSEDATLLSALEGLTYTWKVPAGMRTIGTPGSKMQAIADYGGSYTVSVTVSDARGNTQTLSDSISVAEPPPVVLDLIAANMSKWSHAPLVLGVTTKAIGGHPTDSIVTWKYFIDDVQQTVANSSTVRLNMASSGTFDVRAEITTKMGATASKSMSVLVPANQAPTCAVSGVVSSNKRSIVLKANCDDPDGAIVNYKWALNGTPITLSVGGSWTMILPTGVNLPVTVDLQVTDDGGLTAISSETFY